MKKYSELVNKQFKINKIRNIYTVIGIVLGIVLLTTVGNLNNFLSERNIEEAKYYSGSYEAVFRGITENQFNLLKGNVRISDWEEVYDENIKVTGESNSLLNNKDKIINVGINIKDKNNIKESINEISQSIGVRDDNNGVIIEYNDTLISGYESSEIGKLKDLSEEKIGVMFVNISILLLTSILTYGSINVSMKERIQYFSALRCIGATGDKIRYLLIKESFLLGALSIVPGLVIGNILSFSIVNIVFKNIMKIELYGVDYKFYLSVALSTILMTIFIIIISSIIPVIRAGSISPIQGVKTGGFSRSGVKKRKSKIIRKIFGYKGELAYKNIRGNNKNFIIATTTLSTLLIIFVSVTGYCMATLKGINEEIIKEKDLTIGFSNWNPENDENLIDSIFDKQTNIMKYLDGKIYKEDIATQIDIKINAIFKNLKSEKIVSNEKSFIKNKDEYTYIDSSKLIIYNDEALKDILPYIEGGNVSIQDFKDNGILFVNKNKNIGLLNREYGNISKLNKNDIVSLYINQKGVNGEGFQENSIEMSEIKAKIIGNIDSRHIYNWRNNDSENGVVIIASENFYKNNKAIIDENIVASSRFISDINLINNELEHENVVNIKSYLEANGDYFLDNKNSSLTLKREVIGSATIIYTILIISMAIGIINIINNKTINLSLRKKEFGTMLAIGLKKEGLEKIIMLEGIVQWFVASLIGGIISFIILKIIFIAYTYLGGIENSKTPIWIIGIGVTILLIISLVASKLSL
ncbi:MAG: FtsX-like permease family protein, partial [Clostridium sp.]